jgi:hypothetical protein
MYDITDTKGGKMPDAGNGGNSGCCVMLRIPTAGNLDVFIHRLLPNIIKRYGFSDEETNRLNYALLVDEDQETRQTASLNQGAKEIRFFAKPMRRLLKVNARMAFPGIIGNDVADQMWPVEVKGLTSIFRMMLHISATPLPYLLTHPRETRVMMLDLREDYVGLDGCDARLRPQNRITMVDTEDSIEGTSISVMERHPYVHKIVSHHLKSEMPERLLVWTSVRPNMEMDAWCMNLVRTKDVRESDRPSIFVAYYGSSTQHRKGPGLYCNRAAFNYLQAIVEVDNQRTKLKSELTENEKNYHGTSPQLGNMVQCEDGVKRLLVSKKLQQGDIKEADMSIRFPQSSQHLIRDILTLIDGAATRLGHDPEKVFICVVGGALFKEGVTYKTRDHRLPLTAQVVAVTSKNLDGMDYSKLAQLCGRSQGRRSDGRIPAFYAPTYVNTKLKKAFHLQSVTMEVVEEGAGQGKTPLELVAESNRVVGHENVTMEDKPLKPKVLTLEIVEALRRGSKRSASATAGPSGHRAVATYQDQAARESGASSGEGSSSTVQMDPTLAIAFDQMKVGLGRHFPERLQRYTIRAIIDFCRSSKSEALASANDPSWQMHEVMNELEIRERKRLKTSASSREAHHFRGLWAQLERLALDDGEAWISKNGERSIIHMTSNGGICVRVDVPEWVTE